MNDETNESKLIIMDLYEIGYAIFEEVATVKIFEEVATVKIFEEVATVKIFEEVVTVKLRGSFTRPLNSSIVKLTVQYCTDTFWSNLLQNS